MLSGYHRLRNGAGVPHLLRDAAMRCTGPCADGGAYGIYVGNEFLWDTLRPNTNLRANNESFGILSSLSRTTLKYFTYKPAVTAWHWGIIYTITGSIQTTVLAGSMLWFTLPLMYYVNNTAWDIHDWSAGTGTPSRGAANAAH